MARFYRTKLDSWGVPRYVYPWILHDPDAPSSGVEHESISHYTKIVRGDKDVKHRRIRASVTPEVQDPPSDYSDHGYDAWWQGSGFNGYAYDAGLNDTWTYRFQATGGRPWVVFCATYHYHLNDNGDLVRDYYYYRQGYQSDLCQRIIGGFYAIVGDFQNSATVVTRDGRIVLTNNFWYVTTKDVILKDIFPWFWLDHMEDVHKTLPQNPGALSEVIRNTIAEYTRLDSNNYANILDAANLVKDFASGKVFDLLTDTKELAAGIKGAFGPTFWSASKKTKKNYLRSLGRDSSSYLGGLWLKYRYVYNTTKSDIEDFIKKTRDGAVTDSVNASRVMRGSISIPCGTLRIKMRIHPNPWAGFDRMLINADRRGLLPGLYNLWDLVPFSFVGDWFAPVGDYLNDIDQSLYFRYYKVDELLVSTKEEVSIDQPWGQTEYLWYTRQLLDEFPQWELYNSDSGPSGKTVTYRLLDTLSLAVG